MKAIIILTCILVNFSAFAYREGSCQAHFIHETKDKTYEEALCVQARGVHINLKKNGGVASSLCGKEWNRDSKEVDLIYVEFKTKRKGDRYRLGIDILRGDEDYNNAKRIAKKRLNITAEGKIQGIIPILLKTKASTITGISFDCQVDVFTL